MAHYSFDHDAENRLKDASGHSRDGESHNAIEFISRGKGRAIEFKGQGHHGAEGGHAILPFIDFSSLKEFSLALWVRESNMTHEEGEAYVTFGIDRGVGTADALGIAHLNSSVLFRVGDGQLSVPFAATDRDRWVHYAMTFQNGELQAYKDGQRVGNTPARISVPSRQAALARALVGRRKRHVYSVPRSNGRRPNLRSRTHARPNPDAERNNQISGRGATAGSPSSVCLPRPR